MLEERVPKAEQPTAPFVLSLIAGLWMLVGGGMMGGFGRAGMMGGWPEMMHGWMWGRGGIPGFGLWWPWFGMIAGVNMLVGAILLYVKPRQRQSWGVVILIASALYMVVGMMGLLAGTLGVIGGVLAVAAKD